MKIKNAKKEYEEFVKQECKIHIDKPKGKKNCAHTIMGDVVGIRTMLASLFETLDKYDILNFNDLRHIIDIVEKIGVENESK